MYYGPDHLALTAEEFKFLNESCDREETVSVGYVVVLFCMSKVLHKKLCMTIYFPFCNSRDDSTVWDPNMNEDENAEIMAAFNEFVNHRPRH